MTINHSVKQIGLTAILLTLVAVLESKAALGAWHSVADHVAAVQYSALSVTMALLAFIFSACAGAMKHDVRPHIRGRASLARIVSIACLLIPIGTLASSFKADRLETEWPAYRASAAYQADVRLANSDVDTADPIALSERDAAMRRIQEPTFVSATVLDFEWWYALFLQVIVITGAGIRLSPPATEEEVRHWRSVAAGHKAARTRKRNAAKRAAKKKPALQVLAGGKK